MTPTDNWRVVKTRHIILQYRWYFKHLLIDSNALLRVRRIKAKKQSLPHVSESTDSLAQQRLPPQKYPERTQTGKVSNTHSAGVTHPQM
jgi:hypothetical protein